MGKDFWRSWRSKFDSPHNAAVHVNDLTTGANIGSKFAQYFLNVCSNPLSDPSDSLLTNSLSMRVNYVGETLSYDYLVDVELTDTLISNLKKGRATSIDRLTSEHLQFSHPTITVMTKLFNIMLVNGIVPDSFGTVPIPKCDALGNALSINYFRGISICPVISKLFSALNP